MATHSILLPRNFHGCRSLVGYSPWDGKESDTTEQLHFHFILLSIISSRFIQVKMCVRIFLHFKAK